MLKKMLEEKDRTFDFNFKGPVHEIVFEEKELEIDLIDHEIQWKTLQKEKLDLDFQMLYINFEYSDHYNQLREQHEWTYDEGKIQEKTG